MTLKELEDFGYEVSCHNHASAILEMDFSAQLKELVSVLLKFEINAPELIKGGGGVSEITRRLRSELEQLGWEKHNFEIKKSVDQNELFSSSHEVDHIIKSANGTIALEIEWNNKDTFFDRDLGNFQILHSESAISVGIIITRGKSLNNYLEKIIKKCAKNHNICNLKDLKHKFGIAPTKRQKNLLDSSDNEDKNFRKRWAKGFTADKFGASTTHWEKLEDRISRGVGNPCPLCLIGIPNKIVTQD